MSKEQQLQIASSKIGGPQRRLHMIDVENLCRSGLPTEQHIQETLKRCQSELSVSLTDHVVLAASGETAFMAGKAWPGARVVVGYGSDGADNALLSACDIDVIRERFDSVVLASGDGIFTPLVTKLLGIGVHVVVVGVAGAISSDLRRAGAEIRHIQSSDAAIQRRISNWCGPRIRPAALRVAWSLPSSSTTVTPPRWTDECGQTASPIARRGSVRTREKVVEVSDSSDLIDGSTRLDNVHRAALDTVEVGR